MDSPALNSYYRFGVAGMIEFLAGCDILLKKKPSIGEPG
jgi:hypothetical protein